MDEIASQDLPSFPFRTYPKSICKAKNGQSKSSASLNGVQTEKPQEAKSSVKKSVSFKDKVTNDPSSLVQTLEVESYKEYNQDVGAYSKIGNTTGCSCTIY